MANGNDLFMKMCKEALEDLASGNQTWRELPTNTLFLACFGMLFNHLRHKITRPLWVVATSALTAAIGYVISLVLG